MEKVIELAIYCNEVLLEIVRGLESPIGEEACVILEAQRAILQSLKEKNPSKSLPVGSSPRPRWDTLLEKASSSLPLSLLSSPNPKRDGGWLKEGLRLYQEGRNFSEIARILGVNRSAVSRRIRRHLTQK